MPFLHFEIAETQVGVSRLDDVFDHVGDVSLEICHFWVVFEDVLECHDCFGEFFGGLKILGLFEEFSAELACFLGHISLANEFLGRSLLHLAVYQWEIVIVSVV